MRDGQRDRDSLLKAHEVAAAWFREQLATPAGAAARRQLQERGLTAETIERIGAGYAPATREALKARLLEGGVSAAAAAAERPGRAARPGDGARSVPEPADDPDPPRQRRDRRVRRPGDGRRPAAEVSEFAGNADLCQGPDALRAAPEQGARSPGRSTR